MFTRHRNRHGGGVLIYVKNEIVCSRRSDLEINDVECLWIQVNLNNQMLLLCSMYRPPSANISYFECMLDIFEKACTEDKMIVITGDLNINCVPNANDSQGNSQISLIENLNGWTQLVTEFTRVTPSTSSIIDVIFSSNSDVHKLTGVVPITLSDHYLVHTVVGEVEPVVNNQEHNEVRFRCYKNFDASQFVDEIRNSSIIQSVLSCQNTEEAWDIFKKEFLRISDKHAPIRVSRMKDRYNPWIDNDIVNVMYKRDYLHKVATRTGDTDTFNEYKSLRNEVNVLIRNSKMKYYNDLYNDGKSNSRKLWSELSRLSGKNYSNECDNTLTADQLNEYFSNIGVNTVSHLSHSTDLLWKGPENIYEFKFGVMNYEITAKLLKSLSLRSSIDVIGFDSKLLRLSANVITDCLLYIFRLSLMNGIVPSDWKYARVTPIYKGKGDIKDTSNFRPISVLPHIAKIFEKEIQCQLVSYLIDKDFITLDQSAYRKFHSTTTCLHNTIDEWLQNMDDKLYTGVCFLDISKCFDTIDHVILVKKLQKYGVRNIELKWFQSYLDNRTQSVKHINKLSTPLSVNIGVPQGSTLGPLLFMLFVNDLPMHISNGQCSMYADDTIIYCNDRNVADLNDDLNDTLDQVNEWYKANKLVLNVSKSNAMLIHSNSECNDERFQPILDGNFIDQVKSTKYLGVHIDDKLNFCSHINELTKTLSKKLSWLARLRHIVPSNILKLTYSTYIMPIFDYACTVWGCSNSNISSIQRLQNRAARIICGNFDIVNVRGIDLVKSLGWQTIEERINYFLSVTMYNCVYGIAPSNLCNSIIMACETSDRETRLSSGLKVSVPSTRTDVFKRSFNYRGAIAWNNLPDRAHNAVSTESFKFFVKKHNQSI